MIEIQQTEEFSEWIGSLRDRVARRAILERITRMRGGLHGSVKRLDSGLSELKVDHGPGYRVYFTQRGNTLVLLLCGGDKSTQRSDIKRAAQLASEWEN